jgi:hypothetical protein
VPGRDPTCSVRDCARPTEGVLTLTTAAGTFQLSACDDHGRRASEGAWFHFDLLGSTYLLGHGGDPTMPVHYEPFSP